MALFKQKEVQNQNPLDVVTTSESIETQHDGANVVGNIMENDASVTKRMLDVTPDINQALLENLAPPKSPILTVLKAILVTSVIISIAAYVFFTSQMTPRMQFVNDIFKTKSVNDKLIDLNKDLVEKQTKVNYFRYMQAKGHLDDFIEHGAEFSQAYRTFTSEIATTDDKKNAKELMDKERKTLEKLMIIINEKLTPPIFVKLAPVYVPEGETKQPDIDVFKTALVQFLNTKYLKWSSSEKTDDQRIAQNYEQIKKIVQTGELRKKMINTDIKDMTDKELNSFIQSLNKIVVSNLSTIQQIKDSRVIWSEVMNEIEKRTSMADISKLDNIGLGYGITYTNYDFNAATRKISITGSLKTADSDTFTQHIDLMEKLNQSDMFSDADISSFSKTKIEGEGYTSSIRFNLTLL